MCHAVATTVARVALPKCQPDAASFSRNILAPHIPARLHSTFSNCQAGIRGAIGFAMPSRFRISYVEVPEADNDSDLAALKVWTQRRLAKSDELRDRCAEVVQRSHDLNLKWQKWCAGRR